jgi:multidrug efflux pump subunit AcrB
VATLVFVLLLYLYEQLHVALAMLLSTLSAVPAVYLSGLWLTYTELNIVAMMGMTMMIGIVTEVGVFYHSEYENLLILGANEAGFLVHSLAPACMVDKTSILFDRKTYR